MRKYLIILAITSFNALACAPTAVQVGAEPNAVIAVLVDGTVIRASQKK